MEVGYIGAIIGTSITVVGIIIIVIKYNRRKK